MKLENYYLRNYFSLNSYLKFEGPIPIFISARTVEFMMFHNFDSIIDKNKFRLLDEPKEAISIYIIYDASLSNDGYSLDIGKGGIVKIIAANKRAVRYALTLLNNLVEVENDSFKLPVAIIEDEASFTMRGIIEGYYGTPWTLEERLDMVDFMDRFRLNTYMYAPKSDDYHRSKWFELYPDIELNDLKLVKNSLEDKEIDFYYCISPGHAEKAEDAFKYVGDSDFNRLFIKLKQMIEIGVSNFGLLLDDIDYKLSGENKKIFKRPGIAHAYICNKVNKFLSENVQNHKLVMCPTEYHQIGETLYRNDLKNELDSDIAVFWTGDNVCAEVITETDAKLTKDAFDKELFIWDNFPVSDFTYGVREYIAPIRNRTTNLSEYASAYIINPSIHYQISKIGMITMAHFAWNSEKYDPEISFEIALKYNGEDFYNKGLDYINYNFPSVLSYGNLDYEKSLVKLRKKKELKVYISKVVKSAKGLLELDLEIIDELKPWLGRVLLEEQIIIKLLDKSLTKEELLSFLENIKFSGSELSDHLIKDSKLLTEEEYQEKILKRRGNPWYRVFEEKRWLQK